MKWLTISSLVAMATAAVQADVQYAVVAFPPNGAGVAVSVGGQNHALTADSQVPNLFKGSAPSGDSYQYVITNGQNNSPEVPKRTLAQGATSTGNEFFNRTHTIVDVPALPQAFNPVYPPLFTTFNKSNEVATIILQVNSSAFDALIKAPQQKLKAQVNSFAYISNQEVYTFANTPSIQTSGQSTKDFAKQSYSIDFNDFAPKGSQKSLFLGRTEVKLRAEATDPTQVREKLYLDCLAAAGATTLSGSFVRVFVNNEPYGLYTLMDDASTHLIDNTVHSGNWKYESTGVTYKGNALSPTEEGNLAYLGDDQTKYSADLYKLVDGGEQNTVTKKNNTFAPLIDFTKRLSQINPSQITDGNNKDVPALLDPQNTMVALAMNYLTDSWDGLWYQASNYYLNQDLKTNQWVIISYDFDETFGNGAQQGRDSVPYGNYSRPGSTRPLVDLFLSSPYYKSQFETILKTLVKRFFNPRVIQPRLDAWATLLKEDIEWDYSIPGHSPGTKVTFTVQNFLNNLKTTDSGMEGINEWVTNRSKSLTQQLQFTDADDLPALGPYKEGSRLDSKGNVVPNDGSSVSPGGSSGNGNGGNGSTSGAISLTSSSSLFLGSIIMMLVGTFIL
ncbi:coth protein-domain-containing protein [Halteromyces radiatus]|uniref:coth protein-domain-containing protein n=1 Tax=Halteromyces radiatus TaxID=101107 RepID=UPI0022209407|nr:coth protein-domain-containing protein [Halteromyces radiatus]KAI8098469.1 coth protein-domain-containing protein [Halteromyces radiatus]